MEIIRQESDLAKRFQAFKSGRPRTWDARIRSEGVIQRLKADAARLPWLTYVAVGADGQMIHSGVRRDVAVDRLNQIKGGAIGYAGAIFIGNALEIYTRPLRVGEEAEAVLEKIAGYLQHIAQEGLAEAERVMRARIKGEKG
jgi:hypothetical protein